MYVLIHKDRVLVGPMGWNLGMFEGALQRINILATLPRTDPETLPLVIDDDTRITYARMIIPTHNELTETYYGPFWDFSGDVTVGNYEIKPREIPQIQEILIRRAADIRYQKEISGVKLTVQNIEVTVDTSRETRDNYAKHYLLMGDSNTINWKFREGWLTMSKAELATVVQACNNHVQNAFNWEKNKVDEITSKTTAEDLMSVELNNN